jgi:hypothetical protein
MSPQARYVTRVLDQYSKLPGTLRRVLRQDRRAALDFYRRGVGLGVGVTGMLCLAKKSCQLLDCNLLMPIALHAGGVEGGGIGHKTPPSTLGVVENAFVLTLARRTFRKDGDPLEPIRCLSYFVPVVDELLQEPPLPEYLDYLKRKLITAGMLESV